MSTSSNSTSKSEDTTVIRVFPESHYITVSQKSEPGKEKTDNSNEADTHSKTGIDKNRGSDEQAEFTGPHLGLSSDEESETDSETSSEEFTDDSVVDWLATESFECMDSDEMRKSFEQHSVDYDAIVQDPHACRKFLQSVRRDLERRGESVLSAELVDRLDDLLEPRKQKTTETSETVEEDVEAIESDKKDMVICETANLFKLPNTLNADIEEKTDDQQKRETDDYDTITFEFEVNPIEEFVLETTETDKQNKQKQTNSKDVGKMLAVEPKEHSSTLVSTKKVFAESSNAVEPNETSDMDKTRPHKVSVTLKREQLSAEQEERFFGDNKTQNTQDSEIEKPKEQKQNHIKEALSDDETKEQRETDKIEQFEEEKREKEQQQQEADNNKQADQVEKDDKKEEQEASEIEQIEEHEPDEVQQIEEQEADEIEQIEEQESSEIEQIEEQEADEVQQIEEQEVEKGAEQQQIEQQEVEETQQRDKTEDDEPKTNESEKLDKPDHQYHDEKDEMQQKNEIVTDSVFFDEGPYQYVVVGFPGYKPDVFEIEKPSVTSVPARFADMVSEGYVVRMMRIGGFEEEKIRYSRNKPVARQLVKMSIEPTNRKEPFLLVRLVGEDKFRIMTPRYAEKISAENDDQPMRLKGYHVTTLHFAFDVKDLEEHWLYKPSARKGENGEPVVVWQQFWLSDSRELCVRQPDP